MCQIEKVDLIDLNMLLIQYYNLNKKLQTDGMHLNEKGYPVWEEVLNNYLDSYELK